MINDYFSIFMPLIRCDLDSAAILELFEDEPGLFMSGKHHSRFLAAESKGKSSRGKRTVLTVFILLDVPKFDINVAADSDENSEDKTDETDHQSWKYFLQNISRRHKNNDRDAAL